MTKLVTYVNPVTNELCDLEFKWRFTALKTIPLPIQDKNTIGALDLLN